jgi:hypothetical protein
VVARGIANGVMCYLQPGQAPTLDPAAIQSPAPTQTAEA